MWLWWAVGLNHCNSIHPSNENLSDDQERGPSSKFIHKTLGQSKNEGAPQKGLFELFRTPWQEIVFQNENSWGKHADELAEELGCTTGSNSDLTSWKIYTSNKPSRGGWRWNGVAIRHGSWKKRYVFLNLF